MQRFIQKEHGKHDIYQLCHLIYFLLKNYFSQIIFICLTYNIPFTKYAKDFNLLNQFFLKSLLYICPIRICLSRLNCVVQLRLNVRLVQIIFLRSFGIQYALKSALSSRMQSRICIFHKVIFPATVLPIRSTFIRNKELRNRFTKRVFQLSAFLD